MKRNWLRAVVCFKFVRRWHQVTTMGILVIGLIVAYCQLTQNEEDSRYRYLAGVWNEIMKVSIQHPQFSDKSRTIVYAQAFTGDERTQYEIYARWLGGFVEDLYYNKYELRGYDFYEPWIDSALQTHQSWLVKHAHYYQHTPKLHQRILRLKAPDKN